MSKSYQNKDMIEAVIMYLTHNQQYLKQQTLYLYEQRKKLIGSEDNIWLQDIEHQYKALNKQIICEIIASALFIPVDVVIEVVESIDIERYLNA